jgi:hypothetical protein
MAFLAQGDKQKLSGPMPLSPEMVGAMVVAAINLPLLIFQKPLLREGIGPLNLITKSVMIDIGFDQPQPSHTTVNEVTLIPR